jgi:hypothetical protein
MISYPVHHNHTVRLFVTATPKIASIQPVAAIGRKFYDRNIKAGIVFIYTTAKTVWYAPADTG